MGTSTLHLNNPVPSNGAVAASLGGRHTVTVTLSGVGAISCKVQAWGSEENTNSRMIGAPVVISGTTTVSQTLTFNALDIKQFWLALVEITPACTFSATVENSGDALFSGAVGAIGPVISPNTPKSTRIINMIGDSLVQNAAATSGYMHYAIIASGGRLTQGISAGITGNTPAQMDARFDSTFAGSISDETWIGTGSNGYPLSDATKGAIASMCAKAIKLGSRPVLFLPPLSEASYVDRNQVGQWMRQYAEANGIEWNYIWSDLVDPATGVAKAGVWYAGDAAGQGLHPLQSYHKLGGDAYASSRWFGSNARSIGLLASLGNIYDDPFCFGGSASVATGWSSSATNMVASKSAASAPDAGKFQVYTFTINDAAPSAYARREQTGIIGGRKYKFSYRFKAESFVNAQLSLFAEWRVGAASTGVNTYFHQFLRANFDGTVSFVGTAPANADGVRIYAAPARWTAAGTTATGVISIGMIAIEDMTL